MCETKECSTRAFIQENVYSQVYIYNSQELGCDVTKNAFIRANFTFLLPFKAKLGLLFLAD